VIIHDEKIRHEGVMGMIRKPTVLAVIVGLITGASGLVNAAEQVPIYATPEACFAAHRTSCYRNGDGFSPVETGSWESAVVLPPEIIDPEYAERQRTAMVSNTSGTPEHPVVAVDMAQVIFPDAKPYLDMEIGRVRVPVRFVSEQMGASVTWDNATQTVTITKGDLLIHLQVDNSNVTVNGKVITIDAPPKLLPPGRVMVPLRFVAEAFGAAVDWVGAEPVNGDRAWGKYQVWIWPADGFWGKYTMEERLVVHKWWWYRGPKEATP
jgi:hypothetical protein